MKITYKELKELSPDPYRLEKMLEYKHGAGPKNSDTVDFGKLGALGSDLVLSEVTYAVVRKGYRELSLGYAIACVELVSPLLGNSSTNPVIVKKALALAKLKLAELQDNTVRSPEHGLPPGDGGAEKNDIKAYALLGKAVHTGRNWRSAEAYCAGICVLSASREIFEIDKASCEPVNQIELDDHLELFAGYVCDAVEGCWKAANSTVRLVMEAQMRAMIDMISSGGLVPKTAKEVIKAWRGL